MRKILVGLSMAGVGAVIALGARNDFPDRTGAPDAVPAAGSEAAESGARSAAVGGEAAGGVEPAGPIAGDGGDAGVMGQAGAAERGPGVGAETVASAEPAGGADARPPAGTGRSGESAREERPAAAPAPPPDGVPAAVTAAQEPDAEEVLRRAAAAYADVRSLRADFVQRIENPILGSEITSRGTLYQRRPDRFLMRFSDPAGDVIVSDGRYFWIYYPSVDEKQVIRTPASRGGAGGVDLQAQFLGDPLERFAATLEGKAEVSGRSVYVLTLVPREPVGYRRLKAWVDARDHLVRRFELTENDDRVRRFELRNLEVNVPLEDDLFRFTPPPGARVIDRG